MDLFFLSLAYDVENVMGDDQQAKYIFQMLY